MREILIVVVILITLYLYRLLLMYEQEEERREEMERIKKEHTEQAHNHIYSMTKNRIIFYEGDLFDDDLK